MLTMCGPQQLLVVDTDPRVTKGSGLKDYICHHRTIPVSFGGRQTAPFPRLTRRQLKLLRGNVGHQLQYLHLFARIQEENTAVARLAVYL